MLAPYLLAVVAVAIVVTSFISGIFGMAGGMLLLGLLLLFMDVAPAMVLFGIIQMAANGWRAILWWRHVDWSIVWRFLVGSTAMFLLMRTIAILPSKATIYIGLGLIPFAAYALPRQLTPDITRPGAPYICGAFIIVLQLLAGAAGHMLDIFFQKSPLDRRTIVGTKAVTQVAGHVYRIVYFGSFELAVDTHVPGLGLCGGDRARLRRHIAGGSRPAAHDRSGFRVWSRRITIGVALSYLVARFVACWPPLELSARQGRADFVRRALCRAAF